MNCEVLIDHFCLKNKINLNIVRLFNLYGENDSFSIISKIKNSIKQKKSLKIFNHGKNVRDFIYVDDVANIYNKLLKTKKYPRYLDIGTGSGIEIKSIIDSLNYKKAIFLKSNSREAILSIADRLQTQKYFKNYKFYSLKNFFKKNGIELNEKKIIKLDSINKNYSINNRKTFVIYGAGNAGNQVFKILSKNPDNEIIFYVDDKISLQNKYLNKIKIVNFDYLEKLNSYHLIDNLVIAMPSISLQRKIHLLQNLNKLKCNIITLPSQENITNNKVNDSDLKKINFSDFFGRKINYQNIQNLKKLVHKNIMITGGAGSIGSELCSQVLKTKFKKLIIYDQNENNVFYLKLKLKKFIKGNNIEFIVGDISNTAKLKSIIKNKNIDKVFHAAAYKHVELSENNIHECLYNNIFGTISVVNSLGKSVKNFTLISTDKAAAPISVMGFSKRITEIIVQNLFLKDQLKKINLSIVRFGNVFGSDGSAIKVFEKQLKEGNPLTITNKKATRYFMTIEEACTLVLNSSSMNSKKGIYVLEMGKPIQIIRLVDELIKFFNINKNEVKIKIIGLKKGEKLKEILSVSKNKIRTNFSNIYEYLEPNYPNYKINRLLNTLKNSLIKTNEKKTIMIIKKFLKKEIR